MVEDETNFAIVCRVWKEVLGLNEAVAEFLSAL